MSLFKCSIGEDDKDDNIDVYAGVWASFTTTLALFGALGAACFVFFEAFRSNRVVFASRGNRLPNRIPEYLPAGPFQWIKPLIGISDEDVLTLAGLDGHVFLRFLAFCFRVCFVSAVGGTVVLMPLYWAGGGYQRSTSTFAQLTMDNVSPGSDGLYVTAAAMYLLVIGVMLGVDAECKHFVKARAKFMTAGDADVPGKLLMMYTCLVEDIPLQYRSETALFKYFEQLFPGQVVSAVVHLNLGDTRLEQAIDGAKVTCARLSSALAVRDFMRSEVAEKDAKSIAGPSETLITPICFRGSIERAADARDARDGGAVTTSTSWLHKTVVACPYYERRLEEANAFIAETVAALKLEAEDEESVSRQSTKRYSSSGAVVFKTKATATVATQVLLCNKGHTPRVFSAPDPRDVIWTNSTVNIDDAKRRTDFVSFVIKIVGVFIFIPVLVLCNAFGDIDRLSKLPGLGSLSDVKPGSMEYDFITGQVPPRLQAVVMISLPFIFTAVAVSFEGVKQTSVVEMSVLTRSFGFQLVNIYFTLIGTSIASTLQQIINEPGCAFVLLGGSVPAVAGFFIQMICVNGLVVLPLELSRLPAVASVWWFEAVTARRGVSPEAKRALFEEGITQFSASLLYPTLLLVLILNFTYAAIVPFLSVVCTLYFAIACGVYRHNVLFAYAPAFESGGLLFATLYDYVLTGLSFAIMTMVGYLVIKGGFTQSGIVLCLLPAIEYFRADMASTYLDRSRFLGMDAANAFDRLHASGAAASGATLGGGLGGGDDARLYRQPALHVGPLYPERAGGRPSVELRPSESDPMLSRESTRI